MSGRGRRRVPCGLDARGRWRSVSEGGPRGRDPAGKRVVLRLRSARAGGPLPSLRRSADLRGDAELIDHGDQEDPELH